MTQENQQAPMTEPFDLLADWLSEAEACEPNDPNAMALATATPDGTPSVRMVLLKGFDSHGLVFYTNLESRKGGELAANPQAALLFHWKSLRRQIRVEGRVSAVDEAEADAYFDSRPRTSRIGAWASRQSRPMEGRFEFEAEIARYTAKFNVGTIPRPPHWSGFRLTPVRFEFWRDREFRLHDRQIYRRENQHESWQREILFP